MITKIVPTDVFSTYLQTGESSDRPIDIIVGTNQSGTNTRGVAHEIGCQFNPRFKNLLEGWKTREVPLGHVFSEEGMIEGQPANFHAIAVNRRTVAGGPQDWSWLLTNLSTGLNYLHLNQNTREDTDTVDDSNFIDVDLRDQIARIPLQEWVDYAAQVASLVNVHIESTRRKFRVVLIGGADGRRNHAKLQDTLEAFEASPLMLHLYLGDSARIVRSVKQLIPHIPSLSARNLIAEKVS